VTGTIESGTTGTIESGTTGTIESGTTGTIESGTTGTIESGTTGTIESGTTGTEKAEIPNTPRSGKPDSKNHGTTGTRGDVSPRPRTPRPAPTTGPADKAARLREAREAARGILRAGARKVSRRSLKVAGITGKTADLQELANLLNEEIDRGLLSGEDAA
ncbi:hypothetical protein, partial [Embleya sp. NPDC005971]|uniref:hypothetical protein n=1 Tax=Embleya sp. NPDC005971 TaxID=3156724 RepID=UPI0034045F1C